MTFKAKLMLKVVTLLFLFLCSSISAETLHIVGDENAQPKNWLDESGTPRGIMIDILSEVTRRTGIEFTYSLSPWKRALKRSSLGDGAIIGFSKTSERMETWDYSEPMFYDELVLVTTQDKMFDYQGLQSLNGRSVAIKLGATYGDDFESAVKKGYLKTVETSDRVGQLQMLAFDRIDLVMLSPGRIALESVLAQHPSLTEHRDDYIVLQPPVKLDPNYLGIPKSANKSHLLKPINQAFSDMMSDGTHAAIVDRNIEELLKALGRQ